MPVGSHHLKGRRGVIGIVALMALIAVIGSVSWAVIAQATTFSPTADVDVGPSKAAGANADVTTHVVILPPDAYFTSLVTFVPAQWGVAKDADVPNGALVAHLNSTATLGAQNGPCNLTNFVVIDLLDATTDKSISFAKDPACPPTSLCFPGYQVMPSGLEKIVEQWPAFLNDIPQLAGKQPLARYAGHTNVVGTQVSLQFLLYAPGDLGPAERGYGTVTVLQDPSPGPAAVASVTDNCTKMETRLTSFGTSKDWSATTANEAGYPVRTNPTCGGPNFTFSWQIKSQLDADNDGIENQLDSCPEDPKPTGYNPRDIIDLTDSLPAPFGDGYCDNPTVGDDDCDGIDNSCDEVKNKVNVAGFTDQDGDGFLNRGDNCPTVANPNNEDSDADGIGDACDSTKDSPSGHSEEANPESSVKITGADQKRRSQKIREALSSYSRAEDLINLGTYVAGSNPQLDSVLSNLPKIQGFLKQELGVVSSFEETVTGMQHIADELTI